MCSNKREVVRHEISVTLPMSSIWSLHVCRPIGIHFFLNHKFLTFYLISFKLSLICFSNFSAFFYDNCLLRLGRAVMVIIIILRDRSNQADTLRQDCRNHLQIHIAHFHVNFGYTFVFTIIFVLFQSFHNLNIYYWVIQIDFMPKPPWHSLSSWQQSEVEMLIMFVQVIRETKHTGG